MWKGKKLQKFKYLHNKKNFLDEIAFFVVSEGLSFGEKTKNSGHDLDVASSKCKTPLPLGVNVMSECWDKLYLPFMW